MQNFILQMCYGQILKKMIYMKPLLAIRKENEDLEKQVNKLNNILVSNKFLSAFLFTFLLGNLTLLQAQDRIPFDQGKKYILADVDVTGKITGQT